MQTQHELSPGLVSGDERVCRGAFDPMHLGNKGLKSSFLRKSDLLAGELSVWRIDVSAQFSADHAAEMISGLAPAGNSLAALYAAGVAEVRGAKLDVGGHPQRAYCVLDDCNTDGVGGAHRCHATIALAEIAGVVWAENEQLTDTARELLIVTLKRGLVWERQVG